MRFLATASFLLVLSLAAGAHKSSPARAATDDPTSADWKASRNPEAKPRPKFTPSKETTYVTGPRDADGRIDYTAALNERMRRGVTPATNANVLLWKAFGPRPEGARMPREFYKWLGIKEPPERGDYFIGLSRFFPGANVNALYEDLERASQAPWTAKQYPNIAAWLKASEKPLALVLEATKRPGYFSPLVSGESDRGEPSVLIGALVPAVQRCRELANALPARAMLHAGAGRHAEAWQDLLTVHRLGRHVAHGGTLIEGLVGLAIENIASGASLNYLGRAGLTTQQIKDCLRDLQQLPPMPRMAEKVDLAERFMFLDIVMLLDRKGPQALGAFGLGPVLPKSADARTRRIQEDIDWNEILRTGNRWFNNLTAAMRIEDRVRRDRRLDGIEEDLKRTRQDLMKVGGPGKALLAARSAGARGKLIGNSLITMLLPALRKVHQAGERTEQVRQNLLLAFALAAYQHEHGRYPRKLQALAPGYLPRIPQDRFSGKGLIYHPVESAYLLYSVGVNGQDEHGQSYDDTPPGDDLRVRMPLAKLKTK